jgi:hypothetical protein
VERYESQAMDIFSFIQRCNVVGIAFTTFSLAWTQGRIDLATGFSIAITLIGAVGLFKTLKVSKTSPN